jgi:protein SCO1
MPAAPMTLRFVRAACVFIAGWAFPSFLLFTCALATCLLGVMLVLPAEGTALEQFAEDFRIWCFGYDPATGQTKWAYAGTMLSAPFMLSGITALLWWEPLSEVVRDAPRKLWRTGAAAALLVLGLAGGMGVLGISADAGEDAFAFPAQDLRLDGPAPALTGIVDHRGEPVSLEELRGRVVVVTAIYTRCALACPLILGQVKRVLDAVPPAVRDQVAVVALTFDPEHDGPAELARLAKSYDIDAPRYLLATGEAPRVNEVLDQYGFARALNPDTGIIDHANLFFVIDRGGRLAYRFSLGERQAAWLGEALELLAGERLPSS